MIDVKKVIELTANGRSPSYISDVLGCSFSEVLMVYKDLTNQSNLEIGPEHLRKYIVSTKWISSDGWPKADWRKIETARMAYDNGLVEMVQGRVGDIIIQYVIPRKKKSEPRNYFFGETTV